MFLENNVQFGIGLQIRFLLNDNAYVVDDPPFTLNEALNSFASAADYLNKTFNTNYTPLAFVNVSDEVLQQYSTDLSAYRILRQFGRNGEYCACYDMPITIFERKEVPEPHRKVSIEKDGKTHISYTVRGFLMAIALEWQEYKTPCSESIMTALCQNACMKGCKTPWRKLFAELTMLDAKALLARIDEICERYHIDESTVVGPFIPIRVLNDPRALAFYNRLQFNKAT